MIISRSDLIDKFHISWKEVKQMLRWGDITRVKRGFYEIEDTFLSSFTSEAYANLIKQRRSVNTKLGLQKMSDEAKALRSMHQSISINRFWDQATEEYRLKHRQAIPKGVNKPESKKAMLDGLQAYWSNRSDQEMQEWSKACSIRAKKAYDSQSEDWKLQHGKHVSTGVKLHKQVLRESGYHNTSRWKEASKRQKEKEYRTKKLRGTFNTSKQADACIELLKQAGFTITIDNLEVPYPSMPNLHCDIYLTQIDTWIELHFSHYHNYKPFDSTNPDHLNEVELLQQKEKTHVKTGKNTNQYGLILYTWTDLDVRKRQCAIDNKLNWLCFYSIDDFKHWLNFKVFINEV